ncbi:hypothetical protein NQ318_006084 [Aromia moschata]|uniref:Uncharacterized protein n=1 Tax=Aromia moschata TaxID=1265417 RepID=A0AAV8Z4Q3_9CUCU|nr:hypothetical protein NQ318_006084 [Aromia moschata]
MKSVDFLLTNKDITYEIRTEIKRLGRPILDLIISKTDVGKSRNYSRNFNSSVYDRFKWLCGCPKRNKLFCFICLVMGGNRSAWTQEGTALLLLKGSLSSAWPSPPLSPPQNQLCWLPPLGSSRSCLAIPGLSICCFTLCSLPLLDFPVLDLSLFFLPIRSFSIPPLNTYGQRHSRTRRRHTDRQTPNIAILLYNLM